VHFLKGSGKSTLSEYLKATDDWSVVSQDFYGAKVVCEYYAERFLSQGKRVIIDWCNIDKDTRSCWIDLARSNGISDSVVCVWLNFKPDFCIERIYKRNDHPSLNVGPNCEEIVHRFENHLEAPNKSEGFAKILIVRSMDDLTRIASEIIMGDFSESSDSYTTESLTASSEDIEHEQKWGRVPYKRSASSNNQPRSHLTGQVQSENLIDESVAWEIFVDMFDSLFDIEMISDIFSTCLGNLEDAVKMATDGLKSYEMHTLSNETGPNTQKKCLDNEKISKYEDGGLLNNVEDFLSSRNSYLSAKKRGPYQVMSFSDAVKYGNEKSDQSIQFNCNNSGKKLSQSRDKNVYTPPKYKEGHEDVLGKWLHSKYPNFLKLDEMHGLVADCGFDITIAEKTLKEIFPQAIAIDEKLQIIGHIEQSIHVKKDEISRATPKKIKNQVEILEHSQNFEMVETAEELRNQADRKAIRMIEFFKRAAEAYRKTGASSAKHLVEQGEKAKKEMQHLNITAALAQMKENNPHIKTAITTGAKLVNGSNSKLLSVLGWSDSDNEELEVDLHGLRISEASQIVRSILKLNKLQKRCKSSMRLHLITGIGRHSKGQVPKLKPAIGKLLNDMGVKAHYDGHGTWICNKV